MRTNRKVFHIGMFGSSMYLNPGTPNRSTCFSIPDGHNTFIRQKKPPYKFLLYIAKTPGKFFKDLHEFIQRSDAAIQNLTQSFLIIAFWEPHVQEV
jgi:hypothetical protein